MQITPVGPAPAPPPGFETYFTPNVALGVGVLIVAAALVANIVQSIGAYHGAPPKAKWPMRLSTGLVTVGVLLSFAWVFDKQSSMHGLTYWLTFIIWALTALWFGLEGFRRGSARLTETLSRLLGRQIVLSEIEKTISTLTGERDDFKSKHEAAAANLAKYIKAVGSGIDPDDAERALKEERSEAKQAKEKVIALQVEVIDAGREINNVTKQRNDNDADLKNAKHETVIERGKLSAEQIRTTALTDERDKAVTDLGAERATVTQTKKELEAARDGFNGVMTGLSPVLGATIKPQDVGQMVASLKSQRDDFETYRDRLVTFTQGARLGRDVQTMLESLKALREDKQKLEMDLTKAAVEQERAVDRALAEASFSDKKKWTPEASFTLFVSHARVVVKKDQKGATLIARCVLINHSPLAVCVTQIQLDWFARGVNVAMFGVGSQHYQGDALELLTYEHPRAVEIQTDGTVESIGEPRPNDAFVIFRNGGKCHALIRGHWSGQDASFQGDGATRFSASWGRGGRPDDRCGGCLVWEARSIEIQPAPWTPRRDRWQWPATGRWASWQQVTGPSSCS